MSTAIAYRMGAGFPGSVNRTHPASIFPILNDPSTPVLTAGLVIMYNGSAQDGRSVAAGDAAGNGTDIKKIAGISVRAYPVQQPTAATAYAPASIGAPEPLPAGAMIDRLTIGAIMGVVNGSPNLGDPIYVWAAASSGAHVQGGFEASPSAGNTFQLPATVTFNGPPDVNGNVEIAVNGL